MAFRLARQARATALVARPLPDQPQLQLLARVNGRVIHCITLQGDKPGLIVTGAKLPRAGVKTLSGIPGWEIIEKITALLAERSKKRNYFL